MLSSDIARIHEGRDLVTDLGRALFGGVTGAFCGKAPPYVVVVQALDRLAQRVCHGLRGVWIDNEDLDGRHSFQIEFEMQVETM